MEIFLGIGAVVLMAIVFGVALDHPKTLTGLVVAALLWFVYAPNGLAGGLLGGGLALYTWAAPIVVVGAMVYGLYLFVHDLSAKRGE